MSKALLLETERRWPVRCSRLVISAPAMAIGERHGEGLVAIPRGKPYVWATWLSRVMTGNVSCQWQYWFLARHKLIEEQPATFDSVGWQIRHTRLLTEVRQELMAAGLRLNTEFAFQCRVPGCDVLINGKIDCLAVDGRIVTVYDCKTGMPRTSDRAQVMIYYLRALDLPSVRTEPDPWSGRVSGSAC